MAGNDSPHQRVVEPISIPTSPRRARFGNNAEAANYELNITLLEAEGDSKRYPDRAVVGHENIKRKYRR